MTERDVIREIAESDPYYYLDYAEHACIHCWNWSRNRNDEDSFVHADDCLWVYCREQHKDEFMVIVSEIVPENEIGMASGKDPGTPTPYSYPNSPSPSWPQPIYPDWRMGLDKDEEKDIEEIDEERQEGLE